MQYIEYYGLPGSGKTTKLNEFKNGYYINGKPINKALEYIRVDKKKGFFLFLRQVDIIKFIRLITKYKMYKKNVFSLLKVSINLSICLRYLNRKYLNQDIIVVNDNGFIQTVVSIMKRTGGWDEEFVTQYIEVFFPKKTNAEFNYIDTNVRVCVQRIYERRKDIAIKTGNKQETLQLLENEKKLFDMLSSIIYKKIK